MLTIGLCADNEKKALLENFCIAYKHVLKKHHLIATEATAEHIHAATGLEIKKLLAGSLGGDRQLEAAILSNQLDLLIVLRKVDLATIYDSDSMNSIIHLCDLYSVPVATNIPTAECLIMALSNGDLDWREDIKQNRF